jgi:hypothetical protein
MNIEQAQNKREQTKNSALEVEKFFFFYFNKKNFFLRLNNNMKNLKKN